MLHNDQYNSDSKRSLVKKALLVSLLVGCASIGYAIYDRFQTETNQFEMEEDVVNMLQHTVVASKRWCGNHQPAGAPAGGVRVNTVDGCKTHCDSINKNNSIKGYWWKAWGGGYCGCCTSIDNLLTNWPDATTYSIPVVHQKIADKRYCGHHPAGPPGGVRISNVDDCQTKCLNDNESRGDIQGYWWKAYQGGYCGCCTNVDDLTSNWPDATVYKLPGAVKPAAAVKPAVSHDLIAHKRWCAKDSTKEQRISNLDDCKAYCGKVNQYKDVQGYWWKAWGGGYCGCCTNVNNLATNWPDASVYRLPQEKTTHNLIAHQRYCGHHPAGPPGGVRISNLDDCKMKCKQDNKSGNIKGYWWKAWGGGYCGCCTDVSQLTTNWPDASVYSLPTPN